MPTPRQRFFEQCKDRYSKRQLADMWRSVREGLREQYRPSVELFKSIIAEIEAKPNAGAEDKKLIKQFKQWIAQMSR